MPAEKFVYRHTVAARFQVTGRVGEMPFDFKNHILTITDPERNARFLDICDTMHPRDRNQIKIINADAAANLERSLGPRVSREAFDTSMVRSGVKGLDGKVQMSQVEIDALAEEQRRNDEAAAQNGGLDQVALDEAARLIAEGKTGEDTAEAERLARIAAQDQADAAVGAVDQTAVMVETSQTASVIAEEASVDPVPAFAPAPVPSAGIQTLPKKTNK